VFVQEVPKDEHYSFPYFFTYPDSNSLFKLEKPVSFYSAYFKSVPKELALLHIRQLRQSFLIAKILILDLYCMQVGSNSWYFDIILPFIIPKSTIVDNNTVYEAKILLGYINRTWPDILFNGKKLECPPGEYHCDKKIEFTAPKPDHYDSSGLSKQQWTATVLLKKRKADSLLTITRDYYVRKPCK